MTQRGGEAVGMDYWNDLLGPKSSPGGQLQYPEYVPTDIWMGQYVSEMVDQNMQSGPSSNSTAVSGTEVTEGGDKAAPSAEVKSTVAKVPRWKRRTPEQIEANKLAQKRFRERKKAKQQVKQNEVADLAEKIYNLEKLNASNAALEDENLALQGRLWAREAELQRIKDELDDKTPPAAYEAGRPVSCISIRSCSVDERLDKVEKKWKQAKDQLETYLKENFSAPTSNDEAKISLKERKELERRSLAIIALCMEALTLGGPQLEDLIRTVVNKEDDLMRTEDQSKYAELAKWLNLSDEQRQQVLALRQDVLARLERIYLDRQGLNLRIVGLLVPQGQPDVPSGPGLKVSSAAERASSLREMLAALQRNLVEEQRLESEHHHGIFHRILKPLQGAWFIVRAFPQHCDTLAFMHGVYALSNEGA